VCCRAGADRHWQQTPHTCSILVAG
jgi:hypothetical protein